MEETEMMDLDRLDGSGTQTRAELRQQAIKEYADRIREGQPLDPAVVFKDGEQLYLASGFHRREAYRLAGKSQMPCIVREGSKWDAVKQGIEDNLRHRGERLTRADRAFNVRLVLKMDSAMGTRMSDREIADLCQVSPTMVGTHRKELGRTVQIGQSSSRVGRDGIERRCSAASRSCAAAETRDVESRAHEITGDAIRVPNGDAPLDPEASQERPEPATSAKVDTMSKDKRDLPEFFKGAFQDLGRLKSKILGHRDLAVGLAGRILSKLDHIDSDLQDWKNNGGEE